MTDVQNVEISMFDLEVAINRCHGAHPPSGNERRLHKDVSRMADLYGVMLYAKQSTIARDLVKAEILEAFDRWTHIKAA